MFDKLKSSLFYPYIFNLIVSGIVYLYLDHFMYLVESVQLEGPRLQLSFQIVGPLVLLLVAGAEEQAATGEEQEDEDDPQQGADHGPEQQLRHAILWPS